MIKQEYKKELIRIDKGNFKRFLSIKELKEMF